MKSVNHNTIVLSKQLYEAPNSQLIYAPRGKLERVIISHQYDHENLSNLSKNIVNGNITLRRNTYSPFNT